MRKIKWAVWNTFWVSIIYLATFGGIAGAYNIMAFICWLSFICGLMVTFNAESQAKVKEKGFTINGTAEIYFDIIVCGVLLWFGFWFIGMLYAYGKIIIIGAKEKGMQERKENE